MPRRDRSRWLPALALLTAACAAAADAPRAAADVPRTSADAPRAGDGPRGAPDAHPAATPPSSAPTHLSHGRFNELIVYQPAGPPSSFALLLSGDDGLNSAVDGLARQLASGGAMVAAIDWPSFKAKLEADGDQCEFPDGDLENLSHFVQAYFHNPTYQSPVLVGVGAGATLSYAVLAQAPQNTFAAALTLGFCPTLELQKPLCKGSGLESVVAGGGRELLPIQSLGNPWLNLAGASGPKCPAGIAQKFVSQVKGAAMVTLPAVGVPQYTAGYDRLAAHGPTSRIAPPPAGLSDLPVVEVPAQTAAASGDAFAIIMSGDGGWAGLDQDVAAALTAQGIPVVGLDSLRYYWTARTPDGVAADTDRMIRYYLAQFGKRRVLLIGYSQGADVLPFAVNRLPAATRAHVALVVVMGMSEHALFEFHLTSWVSNDNSGPATLPEVDRITGLPLLCIYGADEKDSLCPKLDPKRFHVVELKGGHHFDGDYAGLARTILTAAH